MTLKALTVVTAVTLVTACTPNIKYVADTYKDIPRTVYKVPPDDGLPAIRELPNGKIADVSKAYIIFDNTSVGKLMILPSEQDIASAGVVRGYTFGAVDLIPTEDAFREAASGYLRSSGRQCEITSIREMDEPVHEISYACSTTATGQPSPL
ncbi:hypothetical protein [Ancylobacter mangrovi]|uniref:hypothetical protein n=1 Tax=Ancylobacter mangrovi TaxID=2972472 RepID=UPI002161A1D5|nr:hypothetical protein [Ancylobacter mangrovi]MCS0501625.1 hypothetical protein [Ancylobacter mangrovi]